MSTFGDRYAATVEPTYFEVLESKSFTEAAWWPGTGRDPSLVRVLRMAIPEGMFTQRAWCEMLAVAVFGFSTGGAFPTDTTPVDGLNAFYKGSLNRGGAFTVKRVRKILVKMLSRDPPRRPLEIVGAIAMCAVLTRPESEIN